MHRFISSYVWIIAALPLLAGGVIAITKQAHRRFAALLAIGSMSVSFLLAVVTFLHVLSLRAHGVERQVFNLNWFQLGTDWVRIGWIVDPLTTVMLVMVTFVGLLIFIYSTGYMAEDANYARFFCFLSLFAGAMLGVVLSNSLLLLFMCWEIVGLTSYLLIGFWFTNPNATAAAKKAFIVTRIGDLGFFLGLVWLYSQTGTTLFYDGGAGCLEHSALSALCLHTTVFGLSLSSAIGILIFCGAAGKSGQVPLHVWLPDAMEGPTPVSALIHAATMVAAGVFLIARIYPLMAVQILTPTSLNSTAALQVVTWIGAITALFGAVVALAQWDIKRILAYSTVSQLGYMMLGLGTSGVAVGMFHLITHAFFKSLLFLGAGSVIHGCSGEQDIRKMGGLSKTMPVTFSAYTCGMLALCGFPLTSGFWSKDEILHSAFIWNLSRLPFYLGAIGAFLTAFYMTRQMYYVYAGSMREGKKDFDLEASETSHDRHEPHESPLIMTIPLIILAFFALFLGFMGTPAWPWFQAFISGESETLQSSALMKDLPLMALSSIIVIAGLTVGWFLYGRRAIKGRWDLIEPLQKATPHIFDITSRAFFINEFYHASMVRMISFLSHVSVLLDNRLWSGAIRVISFSTLRLGQLDKLAEEHVVNKAFDTGCEGVVLSSKALSHLQSGRVQRYLSYLAATAAIGLLLLISGARL